MCAPEDLDVKDLTTEQYFQWTTKIKKKRTTVFAFFLSFLIIIIIACHYLYVGNGELDTGISSITTALLDLKNLFLSASSTSQLIVNDSNTINQLLTTSGCKYANASTSNPIIFLNACSSASGVIGNNIAGVPPILSSVRNIVLFIGKEVKPYVIYVFYAFSMVIVSLYILGLVLKKAIPIKISIGFSVLIVLALTTACSVGMVIVVNSFSPFDVMDDNPFAHFNIYSINTKIISLILMHEYRRLYSATYV